MLSLLYFTVLCLPPALFSSTRHRLVTAEMPLLNLAGGAVHAWRRTNSKGRGPIILDTYHCIIFISLTRSFRCTIIWGARRSAVLVTTAYWLFHTLVGWQIVIYIRGKNILQGDENMTQHVDLAFSPTLYYCTQYCHGMIVWYDCMVSSSAFGTADNSPGWRPFWAAVSNWLGVLATVTVGTTALLVFTRSELEASWIFKPLSSLQNHGRNRYD